MNHSDKTQALYEQADQLVRLCRQLDFRAIAAHQPQAVAALQRAIAELQMSPWHAGGTQPDTADATPPAGTSASGASDDRLVVLERRRRFIEALGRAELGQRVGKLYYSNAAGRQIPFREAPHKRGLPPFDLVVGADFSPVEGYHGIFIADGEVMSCVLGLDDPSWQLRERVVFDSLDRMVETVSLLTAGFPL